MTTKVPTPSDFLRLADRYRHKLDRVVTLVECVEIPGGIDDAEKQKKEIMEFTNGLWKFRQYLTKLGFCPTDLYWPNYLDFYLTESDRDGCK